MSVITRRRLLLGIVGVGGGYWMFGHKPEETTVNKTTNNISHGSGPQTWSGSGRFVGEGFEIDSDGVVVADVESTNEGTIRLYDWESTESVVLQDEGSKGVMSVTEITPSEYQLIAQQGVGEWSVKLWLFNEDVDQPVLTPPITTTGVGVSVVGPVKFNEKLPTRFSLTSDDNSSKVRVYNTSGGSRISLFSEDDPSNGVFEQERRLGGVGFLQVRCDTEWELSLSPVETYISR